MSEKIILYHISDLSVPIILPRDMVYAERYTTYQDHYISVADAFLFTPEGKMILQRRAKNKKVSPNLLHTAIGWHINSGEDPAFTITHECIEEFGHASYIVPDSMEFDTVYEKLQPYNDHIVIMKNLHRWDIAFDYHINGEIFLARDMCHDFVGVFAGKPRNLDGSVSEFVNLSLEEMDERMKDPKNDFTNSIQTRYHMLREDLYEFRDKLIW